MSEDSTENKEYEVGYKKPPKSGQFRPGESGNPRGSSKGVRAIKKRSTAFNDLFRRGMQQTVEIEENGRKIAMPRLQLGIRRRAEAAATGNLRALKELLKLRDVKEGGPLAPTLKASGAFPPMVCGMIDVGEQTGALPDMLMKVADNYEDEVDNATTALTSLLEPILIVFLAVVVGSIVIAMFLPLIALMNGPQGGAGPAEQ